MKKTNMLMIGLIFILAMNTVLFAQATHTIDFEPAGVGAGWNWTLFEFAPTFTEITNPVSGGINTSATVVEFVAHVTDQPWVGCWTEDNGEFTLDATNSTIKVMVYKPLVSEVHFKIEGGTGTPTELTVSNTSTNTWEELTFDFSALIGQTFSRIVIYPDFNFARTVDQTIYFDNIQVPDGVVTGPLPEPTVAAPTPTHLAADVISMFSHAYTDVPVDTWLTGWSQGALEDVVVAGNDVKKYSSVNFVGIETTGANLIDVTSMTHIHMDVWTPDANDFKVKLVDWGADGGYDGGDDTEHELTFAAPATETWISYDIPLTDFVNLSITGNMAQYILSKGPLGIIYLDNMYFYTDSPVPVTLSSFSAIYANSTPTLQWTTQSESNNLGWNIYRSLSENMTQANQINDLLIPGNGTTSEPTDYLYTDMSDVETNTTYWYWLESASYNGETELHGPVTLTIQDDENQLPELPTASILHNNYPNPFNPSTMINFSISQGETGSLTILNAKGQEIESHKYEAGVHQFNWDAAQYSSGIYFYKLETQNYTNIKKMIMMK